MARDRCVYGSYMGRAVGVNISSDASAPNDAFQYVLRVYNRFYRNILARVDINTRTGGPTLAGSLLRAFAFLLLLLLSSFFSASLLELVRERLVTIGDNVRHSVCTVSFSRSPLQFLSHWKWTY